MDPELMAAYGIDPGLYTPPTPYTPPAPAPVYSPQQTLLTTPYGGSTWGSAVTPSDQAMIAAPYNVGPMTNYMSNWLGGGAATSGEPAPVTQGGDYNDVFNVAYSDPAGGATLATGQPNVTLGYQAPGQTYQMPTSASTYGDLSGVSFPSQPVSTAFSAPTQGVQMPTTAATYGDLSGVSFPQPIDMAYAAPQRGVQMPKHPTGGLLAIGDAPQPSVPNVSLAYSAPNQGVQMPTTAATYGDLSGVSRKELRRLERVYGDLSAAQKALASPVLPEMFRSPNVRGPSAISSYAPAFNPALSQPSPSPVAPVSPAAPIYGDLNRNWTPMADPRRYGGKHTNRAPQTGGFVSYGANSPGRLY